MIQVSPNVYVESNNTFCNLGLIITKEGVVMVDTPMSPTDSVKWRDEITKKGKLRYVITTEEHGDHCTNSWFFPEFLSVPKRPGRNWQRCPLKILSIV